MRTSAMARLLIMGLLMGVLMVPLMMLHGVVSERASRRDAAVAEVSGTWGGLQTVGGPVLTVPYRFRRTDDKGKTFWVYERAHFLPEMLQIEGTVDPELRRRSLFEVVVYKSHLRVSGRFASPNLAEVRPAPEQMLWDEATLNLGVSDPRGISRRIALTWNGTPQTFVPGVIDVGLFASGAHAPAPGLSASGGDVAFTLAIDLNGSRQLRFLPGGSETSVTLTSPWPHPSFAGGLLPEAHRTDGSGFSATWRAPYFGRGYPPQWTGESQRDRLKQLAEPSAFGVSLIRPVDIYQQAERAVKYAVLFIVMTFVIAFLWEVSRGALLHPIQYLFLGFAMCVFYLLLLSLSEHVGFDLAYAAAAIATVGLLAWYWGRVLGGARHGALMACALAGLYGFLYLLLRLEDYALLAGSTGLFAMLALVMYLTRRVNWYDLRLGAADSR
jgi:inner membrane protein